MDYFWKIYFLQMDFHSASSNYYPYSSSSFVYCLINSPERTFHIGAIGQVEFLCKYFVPCLRELYIGIKLRFILHTKFLKKHLHLIYVPIIFARILARSGSYRQITSHLKYISTTLVALQDEEQVIWKRHPLNSGFIRTKNMLFEISIN
jgi:hypothetical protein